jgi:hypothetical protein
MHKLILISDEQPEVKVTLATGTIEEMEILKEKLAILDEPYINIIIG